MTITPNGLIRATGISAIVGGLLFVLIQAIHPADTLASVVTPAWALVHYLTLAMEVFFVAGITGIYVSQVQKMGWIGLAGFVVLTIGLLLTAIGGVIEAFVQPLIAAKQPTFVLAMLYMVEGKPSGVDLGAITTVWNASSACFLGGTLLFGFANFRARILSRWASALFAVGLLLMAPVIGLLGGGGAPRLAAVPIGIGLAWLGYSLWSTSRTRSVAPAATAAALSDSAAAA